VDHILRCLARALQDKVILASREPRPHRAAKPESLAESVIFLEPAAHQKLAALAAHQPQRGKDVSPLDDLASRRVPTTWTMYTFLRNAMVGWRLRPEVAVVTLVYVERFEAVSGVAITPDNWQRLAVTCMMLASKVWDDDSFENQEFAKACPLYSVDEINQMERVMLTLLDYKVLVNGSEYASFYFRLRVLGAREQKAMQAEQPAAAAPAEQPAAVETRGVLQPLDNVQGAQLERRALAKQNEWREKYHAHLQDISAQRNRLPTRAERAAPLLPDPDPLNWTL
jgi:hypothetical protein